MKLRHLFSFLAAFTIVACTTTAPPRYVQNPPPDPKTTIADVQPVYIDAQFTSEERSAIVAAAEEWNTVLNGYRRYDVQEKPFDMDYSVITKMFNTDQGLLVLRRTVADIEDEPDLENALAWVPGLGAPLVYVVADRIGTRDLKSIVLHEIGHTLGVDHIRIKGTLMFPYYPFGRTCVDEVTVAAVATLRRYERSHLNHCVDPS